MLIVSVCFFTSAHGADDYLYRWGIVGGYGTSHPGWGDTDERVKTIDIAFRYEIASKAATGHSWYRNRHSVDIEFPVHFVRTPEHSYMTGVNFLSRWTFRMGGLLMPYLLLGGGPLYSNADIPDMSSKINGSYQAGIGFQFNAQKRQYTLDVRYHHISNGGLKKPNMPLNSSKILLGVMFD